MVSSVYGTDTDNYWVKVTYDTGREETYANLHLNEAHQLHSNKLQEQKKQHLDWRYNSLTEHIQKVSAGRD